MTVSRNKEGYGVSSNTQLRTIYSGMNIVKMDKGEELRFQKLHFSI